MLFNNERSRVFAGYSLASIAGLLMEMGNPHHALRTVHIAGTNGKGSTAHFLQRIFCAAGFRTGLYTSPHLVSVNERIRIDDELIDDDAFEACAEEIFSVINRCPNLQPTWFDAVTAIAFRYFHSRRVDYAVIETGLGGRLDSTNVITPLVSIITNVDIDHTALLGDTIEKIAGEKAGIIKKGVSVVTAARNVALSVIEKAARENRAPLFVYEKEVRTNPKGIDSDGKGRFDYILQGKIENHVFQREIENIGIAHLLPVQTENASLAITAALLIDAEKFSDDIIKNALRTCVIPGRLEVLARRPLVVFDPGHNVAALKAVSEYLKNEFPHLPKAVVLHCMADKDVDGIIATVQSALTEKIFYLTQNDERAFVPDEEKYRGILRILKREEELAKELHSLGDSTLVFFTGSFRLYDCAQRIAEELSEGERRFGCLMR